MTSRSAKDKTISNIDNDASIDDLINKIVQLSTLTKSIIESSDKTEKRLPIPKKFFDQNKVNYERNVEKKMTIQSVLLMEKQMIEKIDEETESSANQSINDSKSISIKSDEKENFSSEETKSSRISQSSKYSSESENEVRSGTESRTSESKSNTSRSTQSNNSEQNSSAEDEKEFIIEEKDKTNDSGATTDEHKSTSHESEKIEEIKKPAVITKKKECKKKLAMARKTRKVVYVDEIPREYVKYLRPVDTKTDRKEDSFSSSKSPVYQVKDKLNNNHLSSSPKPKYKIIPCECPDCYWTKLIKDTSLQVITI